MFYMFFFENMFYSVFFFLASLQAVPVAPSGGILLRLATRRKLPSRHTCQLTHRIVGGVGVCSAGGTTGAGGRPG